MIPGPWVGIVLALGTFRIIRLIGWDDYPPVARLRSYFTGETIASHPNGQTEYAYKRPTLAHFLGCVWCQGFWVSVGVYVAWLLAPTGTLYVLGAFALNAAAALIARNLDR